MKDRILCVKTFRSLNRSIAGFNPSDQHRKLKDKHSMSSYRYLDQSTSGISSSITSKYPNKVNVLVVLGTVKQ